MMISSRNDESAGRRAPAGAGDSDSEAGPGPAAREPEPGLLVTIVMLRSRYAAASRPGGRARRAAATVGGWTQFPAAASD